MVRADVSNSLSVALFINTCHDTGSAGPPPVYHPIQLSMPFYNFFS